MRINKEYEWGYKQGYDFAQYEGGTTAQVFSELRNRGISIRTTYGVAFKQGVKDCREGKPRQCTYYDN